LARPKGGNLTATIPCQNFTSANTKTKPNHSKAKGKDNSTQIQKKKAGHSGGAPPPKTKQTQTITPFQSSKPDLRSAHKIELELSSIDSNPTAMTKLLFHQLLPL
jgi:hypothetical protein